MSDRFKTFSQKKVIEGLQELADESYQRRVWLGASCTEMSSFVEAVCGLFDDSGLSAEMDREKKHILFSISVDKVLRQLDYVINHTSQEFDRLPPAVMIGHPKMQEIRQLSAIVLAKLKEEGFLGDEKRNGG